MTVELPLPTAPRSRRKRHRWILLATALLILVVIALAARPVSQRVKNWHARRLARQAEAAISRNDWPQAQRQATAALVLSRTEPLAWQAMAHVLAHATNAQALQFWQMLDQRGQLSMTERQAAVTLAIRTGVLSVALTQINQLLATAPQNATNLWLASQLFAANGERENSLAYAKRAAQADPANTRYQLFLWSVRCGDPAPATRAIARRALQELGRGRDEIAWLALAFLAEQPELTPTESAALLALATNHPHPGDNAQIIRLELQSRARPQERDKLFADFVTRNQTAPADERVKIGNWLVKQGEPARALQLLPLTEALRRKDFFLIHVDALAALGRWKELLQILAQNVPLETVFVEAFTARCKTQLGEPAEGAWENSFAAARTLPEQLPWLAKYAMMNGATAIAKKALRELLPRAPDRRGIYNLLIGLTDKRSPTAELRALLAEMQTQWPEDATLRNDLAYLKLLLGEDLAAQRQVAEALVKKSPATLTTRTTLALACYRQKDFTAALRQYQDHRDDWQLAAPAARAVYAGVLAATGRTAEARELARGIPASQLRPEEAELISGLR